MGKTAGAGDQAQDRTFCRIRLVSSAQGLAVLAACGRLRRAGVQVYDL